MPLRIPFRSYWLPALFLLAACGGSTDSSAGPTGVIAGVQSVSLSSATAQVTVGATVLLTASVTATGTASIGVDWSSSSPAVATVSNGNVTGISAGTTTITATSQFDHGKSASTSVTVVPAPTPAITSISPSTLTVSAAPQTITILGTDFQPGLSLTVISPRFSNAPRTYGPALLQSVTPTSFQVSATLPVLGGYTFQIQNPSGVTSNVVSTSAQFRTSGSTWIPEGVRMTDSSIGFPGGGIADVAAIHLKDGRWRIVFNSSLSAISTDGVSMTLEQPMHGFAGATPDGSIAHLPRLLQLPDGRLRAYFGCGTGAATGICSAVSGDEGVTWTPESGARILLSATGVTLPQAFLSGLSVVPTKDGRWRGYFADQIPQTLPETPLTIMSAVSSDLLNWTVDPGVRIGPGAQIAGAVLHPKAIANADGTITVFYYRQAPPQGLFASTSSDGLTFTKETLLESLGQGGDPDVVQVGNGLRMYYNWGDNTGGAIYSALNVTGAVSASVIPPASPHPR